MAKVLEEPADAVVAHLRRELGQVVLREEPDVLRLHAGERPRLVREELAEEEELVGVEGPGSALAQVAVLDPEQPYGPGRVARLIAHLLRDRLARRLAHVGPAARHRP